MTNFWIKEMFLCYLSSFCLSDDPLIILINNSVNNLRRLAEDSLLDQIEITKNRLEFDWIKMTTMKVNVGTWPKLYNDEHYHVNMNKI